MRVWWAITWKEWLGLRWKLAALTAIPVGCLLGLLTFDRTLIATSLIPLLIAYGAIAPIFLAMHAASEDNSAGTLEFVRGLPIELSQLGLIRILATLTVLLTPIGFAGVTASALGILSTRWGLDIGLEAINVGSGQFTYIFLSIASAIAVSASLFLWTTALAMNQPSELRAGLIGVVTAVVWGAWTMFTIAQWDNRPGNWTWLYGITALGPFTGLVMLDPGLTTAGRVAMGTANFAGMCLLVVIAARRYGVLEGRMRANRLRLRLSSANRALWWMQWQQAWPLGLAGLGTVLGFSSVGLAVTNRGPIPDDVLMFRWLMYLSSIGVGGVWAIVVAAPMFSAELEPRLVSFWRSRPIDPGAWFRIKYLTGALTVVLLIDLPAAWLGRRPEASTAESVLAYLACVPALHLAAYSLAVLIACLVRHTIYAGILSIGAVLFLVVFPLVAPRRQILTALNFEVILNGLPRSIETGRFDSWLLSLAIYLAFTLSVAVTATLAARWAVQKDFAVRA